MKVKKRLTRAHCLRTLVAFEKLSGAIAKWLGTGLQNLLHRFNSGSRLHFFVRAVENAKSRLEQVCLVD